MGQDGQPFVTDGGNYIFDCAFGRIEDADALDEALKLIPGVVENGLFLGLADAAIVAGADGVRARERGREDHLKPITHVIPGLVPGIQPSVRRRS